MTTIVAEVLVWALLAGTVWVIVTAGNRHR